MASAPLSKGSTRPPSTPGKYRLYSMEYCPYAQRARIVLLAKNVPHDIVNIDLQNKPEWYLEINPQGKVPALDTGEEVVIESLDIADFLDKKFPGPSLQPADPDLRARDEEIIKKLGPVGRDNMQMMRDSSAQLSAESLEFFLTVNEELEKRGTPFLGGNSPGMVDYMIWPWFQREDVPLLMHGKKPDIEERKRTIPKVVAWKDRMSKVKAVSDTAHTEEHLADRFKQYFAKK